jgi:large subunit ribosomal protein L5
MEKNKMQQLRIEKVVVNMCVGEAGEELQKSRTVLEEITGKKTVTTIAKHRIPAWEIRPGLEIGLKVTIRKKKDILEFLKKIFEAKERKIKKASFDSSGNLSLGIAEHIDLPGVKYNPQLGIRGFDVTIVFERPGYRVKRRKLKKNKIGKNHKIKIDEAEKYLEENFGVVFE